MATRCTSRPCLRTNSPPSGGCLAVETLAEAAQEGANGRLPEMRAGLLAKDANRALVVEGLAVRPVGNEHVVGVGDRQDARFERNLLAAQSPGIAAAIDSFVVSDHDLRFAMKTRDSLEDLVAQARVTLDQAPAVVV